MRSPRAWLAALLDHEPATHPMGQYAVTVTHTAPDGTVTTATYPHLHVGMDDYAVAAVVEDEDDEVALRPIDRSRHAPPMLRIVLTGRLAPDEAGRTHTITRTPA